MIYRLRKHDTSESKSVYVESDDKFLQNSCVGFLQNYFVVIREFCTDVNSSRTTAKSNNCRKTLPLWNLYFHSPAVNTTTGVIQG